MCISLVREPDLKARCERFESPSLSRGVLASYNSYSRFLTQLESYRKHRLEILVTLIAVGRPFPSLLVRRTVLSGQLFGRSPFSDPSDAHENDW